MNGLNILTAGSGFQHLRDAVTITVEIDDLGPAVQRLDQGLVILDVAIDEDEVLPGAITNGRIDRRDVPAVEQCIG